MLDPSQTAAGGPKLDKPVTDEPAAYCMGVAVPPSGFLTEARIENLVTGRYEGAEIHGAMWVVKPGDRVLELGSGIGVVGAVVAQNRRPEKVVSFEANPYLIPAINDLYRMNGLEDVISVRNQVLIAGDDRPPTLPFHVHRSFLGSSLDPTDVVLRETVEVETADFQTVMEEERPDVLIMDIEGGEKDLLKHGNFDTLRAMVVEFHTGVYGREGMFELKDRVRELGFEPNRLLSKRFVWVCERVR